MSNLRFVDYDAGSEDEKKSNVLSDGVHTEMEGGPGADLLIDKIQDCYEKTLAENERAAVGCITNGMEHYQLQYIADYNDAILNVAGAEFYQRIDFIAGLELVDTKCMKSTVVLDGLREMVNVSRVLLNLYCICKVDVLGIGKYIQLVISKCKEI